MCRQISIKTLMPYWGVILWSVKNLPDKSAKITQKDLLYKKCNVYLQPQLCNGPVVQLVRISACHAGGRGFESRPDRKIAETLRLLRFLFKLVVLLPLK